MTHSQPTRPSGSQETNPLIDHIIQKRNTQTPTNQAPLSTPNTTTNQYDELGIKITDSTDYVVIRILELNRIKNRGLLHSRDDRTTLYIGETLIKQNSRSLYRLSRYPHSLTQAQQDIIWERLLEVVPYLDTSKVVISDHLYWDYELGQLCYTDTPLLDIENGYSNQPTPPKQVENQEDEEE